MKKTLYIIMLFAATLVVTSSCNKLLEVKPSNLVEIEQGITNAAELHMTLAGAYDVFRNRNVMGGYARVTADVLVGEAYTTGTGFEWSQIKTLSMNLFNPIGRDIWEQSYITIGRCNLVIDYIDNNKVTLTDAQKKQWKAEAQFMRGVCYYHLLQYFALPYDETKTNSQPGVPIWKESVLTNEFASTKVQRSTVQEVYDFLIADLKDAETNLPDMVETDGHVTKDGASAFLAKVYFTMNDNAKAFEYSDKVVTTGRYSLDADWTAKWAKAMNPNTVTNEGIFTLVSSATSDNSGDGLTASYRTNQNAAPGFGPNTALVEQLKEIATDVRGTQISNTATAQNIPGVYSTKFNFEYMNAPVISYNEILLIHAEAGLITSQGNPTADLNAIQTRAGVPNTAASLDNIRKERRKELALEGNYFFDLKRIKSNNVAGVAWNSSKIIFQIPDNEQSGNPSIILN